MKKLLLIFAFVTGLFMNAQNYEGGVVLSSSGTVPITLDIVINNTTSEAMFTFSGPSDKYYSVGFDAISMGDAPYIFFTQQSTLQERKLSGGRNAGTVLNPTIVITSDTTDNGVRTIVFTRALTIADTDYFDFSTINASTTLDLIWAEGSSLSIQKHSRKGDTSMEFSESNLSVDLIRSQRDSSYIQLTPNPVEGILTITNYLKLKTIAIYDMAYKKIATYDAKSTTGTLDMSAFDTGTYLVKSTGNDGSSVAEFVIKN